jgi:hypothetical protein
MVVDPVRHVLFPLIRDDIQKGAKAVIGQHNIDLSFLEGDVFYFFSFLFFFFFFINFFLYFYFFENFFFV